MKAPIYVRALSPVEQAGIEAGLRSSNAFTLRRSQILLVSSREQRPKEIAHNLGCACKPYAMRSMLLSKRAWSVSNKNLPGQKRYKHSLTRPGVKRCELCCTRVHERSAKRRVVGRWNWPHRTVLSRA